MLLRILCRLIKCAPLPCFPLFTCCLPANYNLATVNCNSHNFLTVTPFGVFFICNLISFSCTLCLCYCLLLLTNLKYGLGKNSTNYLNYCGVLSVMPCLDCASLKLTSIDSLLYASPLVMFVWYAMLEWDAMWITFAHVV